MRGFDEFFGFLGGAHSYLSIGNKRNYLMRGTEPVSEISYLTDMFGDEAISFVERHEDEPWFLYLAFNADHTPMQATEKYLSRFPNISDPLRQKFAAMHSAMDDNIGKVLETLRQHQLERNTLIFFLSDNGGPTRANSSRNTPLRGFKAQTWEGGIRVPMIVQWRGTIPEGRVYDDPVIQLDVLPTALAAAGSKIRSEYKLDGVSLLPYLEGKRRLRTKSCSGVSVSRWQSGKAIGSWSKRRAQALNPPRDVGRRRRLARIYITSLKT
jgi:arylsulfatase A-like enzyme